MSLIKFNARLYFIRSQVQLSERLRKHVGLKSRSRSMAATYFTKTLSQQLLLRRQENMPKTSHGMSSNMYHFNLFPSTTSAQDHLISGLINEVLQLWFRSLYSSICRKRVNNSIQGDISKNNQPITDAVLRCSPSDETLCHQGVVQLKNVTMSNLFCVVRFASNVFDLSTYMAAPTQTFLLSIYLYVSRSCRPGLLITKQDEKYVGRLQLY